MLTDHSAQNAAKNGASKVMKTKLHTGAFGLENCIILYPNWTPKFYYLNLHTAFNLRSFGRFQDSISSLSFFTTSDSAKPHC
jgi:hypothetical protein